MVWILPAVLLVLILIRAWWEPTVLVSSTIHVDNFKARPDQAAVTGQPLRILLLSDLHAEHLRLPHQKLLSACAASRPDLVLFAGDLAGKPAALPLALALIQKIRSLPEIQAVPFLAVRGNHDDSAAASSLRQAGIMVLDNAAAQVEVRGKSWLVIGLEDLKTGHPDASEALKLADQLGLPPERRIVLTHNPDAWLDLPENSAALYLAGHLHGGQIWLPFRLEFYLLRGEKLPRIGHYRGSFIWRGTPAFISRGLGCVKLPLRLFSRPEVNVIEIS